MKIVEEWRVKLLNVGRVVTMIVMLPHSRWASTRYAPHVVAATAIYLAARMIQKALPDGYDTCFFLTCFGANSVLLLCRWWRLCEATIEQLEDCGLQILRLYEMKE